MDTVMHVTIVPMMIMKTRQTVIMMNWVMPAITAPKTIQTRKMRKLTGTVMTAMFARILTITVRLPQTRMRSRIFAIIVSIQSTGARQTLFHLKGMVAVMRVNVKGTFDGDEDVDGGDAAFFKSDFGRSGFKNPGSNDPVCKGVF